MVKEYLGLNCIEILYFGSMTMVPDHVVGEWVLLTLSYYQAQIMIRLSPCVFMEMTSMLQDIFDIPILTQEVQ